MEGYTARPGHFWETLPCVNMEVDGEELYPIQAVSRSPPSFIGATVMTSSCSVFRFQDDRGRRYKWKGNSTDRSLQVRQWHGVLQCIHVHSIHALLFSYLHSTTLNTQLHPFTHPIVFRTPGRKRSWNSTPVPKRSKIL